MTLKVALLADDRQQLNHLAYILRQLDIVVTASYVELQPDWQEKTIEFWLIVSSKADEYAQKLNESSASPMFFTDQIPSRSDELHYKRWCQSLIDKIAQLTRFKPLEKPVAIPDIWILAASLGGPEAVKAFFSAVQPSLPISFIYGQHIASKMIENLIHIVEGNSYYSAQIVQNNQKIEKGKVHILSAESVTQLDSRGKFLVEEQIWDSPYTPNLNQMMSIIPANYYARLGIIIFSGMCDDGVEQATDLASKQVTLWVQQPDDCICASMPDAALASGKVSYAGTAIELAQALNLRYSR